MFQSYLIAILPRSPGVEGIGIVPVERREIYSKKLRLWDHCPSSSPTLDLDQDITPWLDIISEKKAHD